MARKDSFGKGCFAKKNTGFIYRKLNVKVTTLKLEEKNSFLIRMLFLKKQKNRIKTVGNILNSEYFTHYRPAMPFGNRNKYFRGSF